MTHHDADDPLTRVAALAHDVDVPAGPSSHTLSARVRRRRQRRNALAATAAIVVAALGTLGVLARLGGDDARVDTAAPGPRIADPLDVDAVPRFVTASAGWTERDIPGVIDRLGQAAPVYVRSGDEDTVVLILGESIPCLTPATCNADRFDEPGALGFLDIGELATATALYVPAWNDDLHLGRRTDVGFGADDQRFQFVGAENVSLVLRDLVARGTAPERLVLVGIGGGGIGATAHTPLVAETFPAADLVVVLDGMVTPGNDTLARCTDDLARRVWSRSFIDRRTAAEIQRGLVRVTDARFVQLTFEDDPQLRRFLTVLGRCEPDDAVPVDLDRVRAATENDVPGWVVVTVPGTGHSVLDRPADDPRTERVVAATLGFGS